MNRELSHDQRQLYRAENDRSQPKNETMSTRANDRSRSTVNETVNQNENQITIESIQRQSLYADTGGFDR